MWKHSTKQLTSEGNCGSESQHPDWAVTHSVPFCVPRGMPGRGHGFLRLRAHNSKRKEPEMRSHIILILLLVAVLGVAISGCKEKASSSDAGLDRAEPAGSPSTSDLKPSRSPSPSTEREVNPPPAVVDDPGPQILDTAISDVYREGRSHLLTLEQIKTIAASGICPPDTTGEQRQDLMLTLAIAVRLLPSERRLSIPEIQPDPAGDPLILIPREVTNEAEQLSSNLRIAEAAGLAKVTNVGGPVLPPGSSRLADAFLMTKGDSPADTGTRRSNVRSYVAVRTMPGFSTWVLGTELPKEAVPYSMNDGRGLMGFPKPVMPNGEGSIFRFRGTITDFFPGWTIHADDKEPLCFVLLRGEGLTYLFGRGSMVGPGDRRLEFVALSRTGK